MSIKIDLHLHTAASFDCSTHPSQVIRQAKRRGLNRICITDHNRIAGADLAQQIDPDFVIMGEEILTTEGEILAFFVKERVPPRLSPQETVLALKEQGAVISLSHPFDPYRQHWSLETIEALLPDIDAVEGFNARCINRHINEQAMRFAAERGVAVTAGSDAHTVREVGMAYLEMPCFSTAAEFRAALSQATICGHYTPNWSKLMSTFNNIRGRVGLKPTI